MATRKYLSLEKLTEYDALLKAKIADSDASTLESAKGYADEKLAGLTSGTTEVAKATEATHATSADTATNATNATKAEEATHATSADTATNANHATSADTATNATNAEEATHAVNADKATNADNATKATQDASGNVITETYETKADSAAKLTEAKGYADTAASNAANQVKNDLLNGAGEAYDTLKELGDLINDNQDAIGALETVATNKADKEHDHTVADITDYVAPVQSDWNQNDETALDYVKNRPCYFGDPVETTLIEETTLNFDDGNYNVIENGSAFEVGQTYTVVFDETTYECVAWADPYGVGMLGNGGFYDIEGAETDDPFLIEFYDGAYCITTSTSGDHTIAMSAMLPEVIQLDEKFISYKPGKKFEPGVYNVYDPFEDTDVEITVNVGGEIFNRYSGDNFAADYAHAEGSFTVAAGESSHAEGSNTKTLGASSHAEGHGTSAMADCSHAEGRESSAHGEAAHAEGAGTNAIGEASHSEGHRSQAYGVGSHAEGDSTLAASDYQHVQGINNIVDEDGRYAHIVGNGDSIQGDQGRSNAHTLDWDGNAWFAGDVYVGGNSQDDEAAVKLMTERDFSWDNLNGKPFGIAAEDTADIISENCIAFGEYEFKSQGGYSFGYIEEPETVISSFNQDRFYGVMIDGAQYYCTAVFDNYNGGYTLGSPGYNIFEGLPTEFPFKILITDENIIEIYYTEDSNTTHEIGIFEFEGTYTPAGGVTTIKTYYLPEQYQFGECDEYIHVESEEVILPSQTYGMFAAVDNYYSGSIMYGFSANRSEFDDSKFYKITWDGVEYYCSVFDEDKNSLGTGEFRATVGSSWADIKAGTASYPFSMYYTNNNSIHVYAVDSIDHHTVAITECDGTCIPGGFRKIDPKYLPDSVKATVTVDSELSTTSTNPVQNKLITEALNTNTSAISANTSSIQAHTTAIGNLQTAVAEFEEITSAEITALFA